MSNEASNTTPSSVTSSSTSAEASNTDLVPKEQPKTVASIIEEKAPEVLKALPKDDVAKLRSISFQQTIMRSGPLPDPAELEAYNRCVANGAERILAMAENQSAHRIALEKLVVSNQQVMAIRGQWFALLIALTGLGLSTWAAMHDKTVFATSIGGATLVTLVSAFLYSKHAEKSDGDKKKERIQMIEALQLQQSEISRLKDRNRKRK